jgi:tRNA pseudouridine55 synthase
VNGLLVIDKPGGMTSHDVVARLRRITGEKSIGHLGTLDPMATGVLPLLLGKFTRLAQYFASAEKSYSGTIRFGFSTDTYDAEGEPTSPPVRPELELAALRAAAVGFRGEILQLPPPFSAKKIEGTPAYKLARAGKPVQLKSATIHVSQFEVRTLNGADAEFEIKVSAGGYVRSIAHDLGQQLGCGAHLSRLRRTQAGSFTLTEAHTLEELMPLAGDSEALEEKCLHPRSILPCLPAVTADHASLGRLRNGGPANLAEFSSARFVKVFEGRRNLVAIAQRLAGTLFQPVTVLG